MKTKRCANPTCRKIIGMYDNYTIDYSNKQSKYYGKPLCESCDKEAKQ